MGCGGIGKLLVARTVLLCQHGGMQDTIPRAHERMIQELQVLMTAIDSNLNLLALVVSDLLNGNSDELLEEEETLGMAIDEVLYLTGLASMKLIDSLQGQAELMEATHKQALSAVSKQHDELVSRWNDLAGAVHQVWNLRMPCQ